jgi:hypothetical protein
MRPSNKQRSRNKPGNNGHNQRRNIGNIINRVFESAGPDGKVRGTPQQIIDKYQALARDAQVSGDRVTAESFLQHAEHYSRLLGEAQRQQMESRLASSEREEPRPSQGSGDEGGFEPQRRQPHYPQPVASGLTMIDTDDGEDFGGPIETPEERRARRDEPAPIVEMRAPQASHRGERAPQAGPRAERAPQAGAREERAPKQAAAAPEPPAPQAAEPPVPQAAEPAAAPEAPAPAAEAQPAPQPEEAKAEEAPAPKPKRTRRRRTAEAPAEPSAQPETAPVAE